MEVVNWSDVGSAIDQTLIALNLQHLVLASSHPKPVAVVLVVLAHEKPEAVLSFEKAEGDNFISAVLNLIVRDSIYVVSRDNDKNHIYVIHEDLLISIKSAKEALKV